MKKILSLLLISVFAFAIPYPNNNPKDILIKKETANGNTYSVSVVQIDKILNDLYYHAGSYPPKFDNISDKNRAINNVKELDYMLSIINDSSNYNFSTLLRQAQLNSIGHNLDINGSEQKAEELFQKILKNSPKDLLVSYYYGIFLAQTGQSLKAIPFLNNAVIDKNFYRAYFVLGLTHLSIKNNTEALKNFRIYKSLTTDSTEVDKIIDAITSNNIEIKNDK